MLGDLEESITNDSHSLYVHDLACNGKRVASVRKVMNFTPEEVDDIYYALTSAEMVWRDRLMKGSDSYSEDECRAWMKKYHDLQQKVFWLDKQQRPCDS
jgi:hypothetical protein